MKEQFDAIIKSDGLRDISMDLVEQVIDSEITNQTLKSIPIVKQLVAVKNIYTSYTDHLFIKKAMHVLFELGDVDWNQRTDLTVALDDDDSNGTEKILMAIDKLDSVKKCKVFGRLCRLKATNKINVDEFLRLTKVIQDAYLDDLHLINDFGDKFYLENIHAIDYHSLITLGLIVQGVPQQEETRTNDTYIYNSDEVIPESVGSKIKIKYHLTRIGIALLENYNALFPSK